MEINRNNIFEITNKTDIRPDKDYGQNFLIEPAVSEKIVNTLNIESDDKVLEIGPGLGSLTHFLLQTNADLTVVDIDPRMTNFLKNAYQNNRINIIENDIRKIDLSDYTKIIGNLPYNITTETIQYVLLNAPKVKQISFMIQSETYNHFADVSGKEYGPSSVLIHLLGDIQKQFVVKAGSFYPAPKCSSTVFVIKINNFDNRLKAIEAFKLSKQLFLNRRKTIYNNLVNYLRNKDLANNVCALLHIDPLSRPEQLLPETYLKLFEYLNNK